jgi:hypothetical protein
MTINTSPVFKGTLDNGGITFTSTDTTAKKSLCNAVSGTYPNGIRIEDITICTDDTVAVNLAFYRYDGTTYYYIGNVNIPAGSGYTSIALIEALRTLAPDLGFIDLKEGWQLACNCVATMTAAKTTTLVWAGGSMKAALHAGSA